jgi:tetratricopeptide (TPR) repeat protein
MRRARRSRWQLALLGVALGLSACDQPTVQTNTSACPPCAGEKVVVDPALLAFLSKARAAHRQADMAEDGGDSKRAIAALARLVEGPAPGGGAPPPEAREVMADTLARMAELRSGLGEFDRARSDLDRGLALARDVSHFRGRLFEVKGVVEERRAKALADQGDSQGAKRAKEQAIQAFEQAIEIQDKVIGRALGDGGLGIEP